MAPAMPLGYNRLLAALVQIEGGMEAISDAGCIVKDMASGKVSSGSRRMELVFRFPTVEDLRWRGIALQSCSPSVR